MPALILLLFSFPGNAAQLYTVIGCSPCTAVQYVHLNSSAQTYTSADVVELNRYYVEGSLNYAQLIFWNLERDGSYVCRGYLMDRKVIASLANHPETSPLCFIYKGRLWRCYFVSWRETSTDYDPEMADRERVPKRLRRPMVWETID